MSNVRHSKDDTKTEHEKKYKHRESERVKIHFAENQNILSQCIHFKMEMRIEKCGCLCFCGNKCTAKFRSENNKRAETGFMVKARGKK